MIDTPRMRKDDVLALLHLGGYVAYTYVGMRGLYSACNAEGQKVGRITAGTFDAVFHALGMHGREVRKVGIQRYELRATARPGGQHGA